MWVARHQRDVSYPEQGNEACFALEDDSFWCRHRNNIITQLVGRFSPSAAFFDIGGGNGCVSSALQSVGIDTVLVEPGPIGAINARKRRIHMVIQSAVEDVRFAPQSIPSAGLFDVIEHIEKDTDFMRVVSDYLSHMGLFM